MARLLAGIGLALMLVLFVWWETSALDITHLEVSITGLPAAFDGFRMGLASDLHGRRTSPSGQVVTALKALGVDVICVVGDFVHQSPAEIHKVYPFMEALGSVAPTYAVSGNHDHRAGWSLIAARLTEAGVIVLENRHVVLERDGEHLVLAGVSDPYSGHDRLAEALPAGLAGPVVLLAHAPTWFEPGQADRRGGAHQELLARVALTLTGHTHGGQIKLPLLGAVTTASGRLFPRTHVQGLSREGDGWLYITRGLGQGGPMPVRLGSRPELAIITLRRP
ncbi:MAG: metallophosphoesterase family protein [Bacillota bacterium]